MRKGIKVGICAGISLGDLERVEVLKGPQGTQFGKNASLIGFTHSHNDQINWQTHLGALNLG
jgi:hypothetical protein